MPPIKSGPADGSQAPVTSEAGLAELERAHWILLSMVAGVGPVRSQNLVGLCGSARAAWRATTAELAAAGFDRRSAESLLALRRTLSPESALERLDRLGIQTVTLVDSAYPAALRHIADPPPVLYLRGRLDPADERAVGIVGTRRATAYGRAVAERLGRELAFAGVTVVSGLAKGVDTAAHRAAVEAGGRTLAVLGNGLDQVYPPENGRLARDIVDRDLGAVISEFPPGVPPDAVNFPRRNRIISGLSAGVVIIEAGYKSGALITADFALEQGREVFAVPGSILSPSSAGANSLLKQGATPVTEIADVLDLLGYPSTRSAAPEARPVQGLDAVEMDVLSTLTAEPRTADEVSRFLGRPSGDVAAALTMLELKGFVRHVGAMAYVRA